MLLALFWRKLSNNHTASRGEFSYVFVLVNFWMLYAVWNAYCMPMLYEICLFHKKEYFY